jgi:adenosylcobinamide kinase/adenosylcobinamide-phosphate guanylyltransferase
MSIKITFITGGARSGKSSFALKSASALAGQKAYLATAESLDQEMKERISRHREERGSVRDTHEEPVKIADTLKSIIDNYDVVLLDCLTLWLSNLVCSNMDCEKDIDELIDVLRNARAIHESPLQLFIVSNEVGMGIVPDNEIARRFRDLSGILNQKVAQIADEAYLVTAGIPMRIK